MGATLWIKKRKSDEELTPITKADQFFPVELVNELTVSVLGHYDKTRAREMFCLINRIRQQQGVALLRQLPEYQNFAAVRAREISCFFEHERPSGLVFSMGENLAMCTEISTNRQIFDSWCHSPEHFANITGSEYSCTGIACFLRQKDNESYEEYWSQVFR